MSAHDFTFPGIDGRPLPLAEFRGGPVLVVNTASACGFTPQYHDLVRLWETYRDRGLVVLGVPSNDFGQQEPGDEARIREFCTVNYGVAFPMTAKQAVVGPTAHPFYHWIEDRFGAAAAPRWNFHKYLIDADGELAGAWPSKVSPLAPEIVAAIEDALPS